MEKKKLVILTSRFPFDGGEYFLELESKYWTKSPDINIFIVPFFSSKNIRELPPWVQLRTDVCDNNSKTARAFFILKALLSPFFFRELNQLYKNSVISIQTVKRALLDMSRILQFKAGLDRLIDDIGDIDLIYSYWNNNPCYAAALQKMKGRAKVIFSRAHGSDLYRHALQNRYMPYKDQFAAVLDTVHCVSVSGQEYYVRNYPINSKKVAVSRLGVHVDDAYSAPSPSNQLRLISISNCILLKRLHIIVDGINLYARTYPHDQIEWTHLGDGPTLDFLKSYAQESFSGKEKIKVNFLGRLKNNEVVDLLQNGTYDAIVNVSASEGVPVSLMEAMAKGILPIAPEVGGISEIVQSPHGYLMKANPDGEDLKNGLEWARQNAKDKTIRAAVKEFIVSRYNASRNYSQFYGELISVIRSQAKN